MDRKDKMVKAMIVFSLGAFAGKCLYHIANSRNNPSSSSNLQLDAMFTIVLLAILFIVFLKMKKDTKN